MPKRAPRRNEFKLTTPNSDAAKGWLKEADRFLKHAESQLSGDHADSVAHSSKTIEFAAKGILALTGIAFPESHRIGQRLALAWPVLIGGSASQLRKAKRHIARVGWLCDVVAPLQSISEYGYAGKRARFVVNQTDAVTFHKYGQECLGIANAIASNLTNGTFRLSEGPDRTAE